ncbi:hypothetical protein [Candidatus Palauibacter sp.]|uniref:hypothetical protein n=1 Tax=Candidatus Palauibacter sp. TaxID=3101350 RepID=UPI003CC6A48D
MGRVRPDAMAYVAAAARAALGTRYCWFGVARDPTQLPHVVYYGIGEETVATLDRGSRPVATRIRIDMRAATPAETISLDRALVAELRAGGRLKSLQGLQDDYEVVGEAGGVHRRIRSVAVR